jgi:cardiolipin synthase
MAPKPLHHLLFVMRFFTARRFKTLFLAMVLLSGCASAPKELSAPAAPASRVHGPEFRQAMGAVLGPLFIGGNRVETLENGNEIFPAMLRAIRSAQRSITFETYIFHEGEVPEQFARALAERARAGVKVHVILDGHGARKSRPYHRLLREAGVDLAIYSPAARSLNPFRYNNRTHRKLLVVDGRAGFLGGAGIADEWAGNADSPEHWRDLHYRVEGPVVAELQGAFMDSWLKSGRHLLHGPDYFPSLSPKGNMLASAFYASPEHGSRNIEIMVNLAISSARKSLLIANSYFVPDKDTVEALVAAARRGVRVQIIVPGEHIDAPSVRRASHTRWGRLLEAGVEIYEYQPTLLHSKLLIADELFVSIGSANLDYRSLRINAEANLNILDAGFAAQQARIFQKDLSRSKRITPEEHQRFLSKEAPLRVLEWPLTPQL